MTVAVACELCVKREAVLLARLTERDLVAWCDRCSRQAERHGVEFVPLPVEDHVVEAAPLAGSCAWRACAGEPEYLVRFLSARAGAAVVCDEHMRRVRWVAAKGGVTPLV